MKISECKDMVKKLLSMGAKAIDIKLINDHGNKMIIRCHNDQFVEDKIMATEKYFPNNKVIGIKIIKGGKQNGKNKSIIF